MPTPYFVMTHAQNGAEDLVEPLLGIYRNELERMLPQFEALAMSAATEGQARRASLIAAQIREEINRLNAALQSGLTETQRLAMYRGSDAARESVHVQSPLVMWDNAPLNAVQAAVKQNQGDTMQRMFRDIAKQTGEDVQKILYSGITAGKNPRAVAREMHNTTMLSASRSEVIARTEQIRAFRVSSLENYHYNGIEHFQRLATKSLRTCPACLALDGKMQPTDELMAVHPMDRCTVIPIVPDAELPPMESAQDWFDRQSQHNKRIILGPGGLAKHNAGVPLTDFATEEDDPDWGPTLRVTPNHRL